MLQSIAQQSDYLSSGLVSNTDYLAVVVDNNDPEKLQRIKVSITGVLESDDVSSLPWVLPVQAPLFGVGDNYGVLRIPRIGSKVIVRYGDNPPFSGVYVGDVVTARTTLPDELQQNYPNRIGWNNPAGDIFYTDLSTNIVYYRHNSGTSLEITAEGDMRINVARDLSITVNRDYTLVVQGDSSTTVQGDATSMTQGGDSKLVSGDASVNVGGKANNVVGGKLSTVCASHTHVGKINSPDDITAAGISLSTHVHQGGTITSPPV